ncbi:hypothetical protein ACFLR2_01025 [Chlamydiota bacterium]
MAISVALVALLCEKGQPETRARAKEARKIVKVGFACDVIGAITLIVLAILSFNGILSLPPTAASWAFVGGAVVWTGEILLGILLAKNMRRMIDSELGRATV